MSIQRIYRPGIREDSAEEELGPEDHHYLKHVLRLKPGIRLVLFDGRGREYESVIRDFGKQSVLVNIVSSHFIEDALPPLTLAQALPKENKMDFIIQKATELGIERIIPFISSRTVPRLSADKASARLKRWRKIAAEAAKQCGSPRVPDISNILSFDTMLDEAADIPLRIFFWEEETQRGIGDILREEKHLVEIPLFFVVGPEGGFSRDEVETARGVGFTQAHLGRRILRAETAPLVILSIIQYERGAIGTFPGKEAVS